MILAILISAVVVALCSAIHYVTLKQVSDAIASGPANSRGCHLSMTIASITMAHVIEALIYTFAFIWAVQGLQIGDLKPSSPDAPDPTLMD
ncbi:MAG: hypothetical protein ACU0A8_00910 [Limimaricola soesokkakensis]|uniref:hypothetical protein n=1 Tax=Limimaricola soesokkakensis TaxID=1343159 RepID=UPI004059A904